MKTTLDLPDEVFHRVKMVAAQSRATLKTLVINGLQLILNAAPSTLRDEALGRLRIGLHLGGHPLSRDSVHARF